MNAHTNKELLRICDNPSTVKAAHHLRFRRQANLYENWQYETWQQSTNFKEFMAAIGVSESTARKLDKKFALRAKKRPLYRSLRAEKKQSLSNFFNEMGV